MTAPALEQLRQGSPWRWVVCERCLHREGEDENSLIILEYRRLALLNPVAVRIASMRHTDQDSFLADRQTELGVAAFHSPPGVSARARSSRVSDLVAQVHGRCCTQVHDCCNA
jgi:hypothetical protein